MFNLAEAVDVCESHAQCRAFVVTNQTTWTGEPVGKDVMRDVTGLPRRASWVMFPHQQPEMRDKYMCPPGSHIRESGPASRERNIQTNLPLPSAPRSAAGLFQDRMEPCSP